MRGCSAGAAVEHVPVSSASLLASSDVAGQVPLPPSWFGTPQVLRGGDPFEYFDRAVQSATSALQSIIGVFGSHTTTRLVKEETCLGFEHYRQNVSTMTLECLADAHVAEAILQLLQDDLLWWFNGDKHKMANTLIGFEYTTATNWTEYMFNIQSTDMSLPRYLAVYKNKEKGATCSNWVIVKSEANIQLAPDLFIWDKSTSRLGGLFQDDEIVVQKVPHKISPSDVLLLQTFFKALIYMQLADTRGISYTMPKLPQCTDSVVVV